MNYITLRHYAKLRYTNYITHYATLRQTTLH